MEGALLRTKDKEQKLSLLGAIRASQVNSIDLFHASQKLISDPDPEIQIAAIQAITATGIQKANVAAMMENLMKTLNVDPQVRSQA